VCSWREGVEGLLVYRSVRVGSGTALGSVLVPSFITIVVEKGTHFVFQTVTASWNSDSMPVHPVTFATGAVLLLVSVVKAQK
jgi:hypothetical protein